MDNAAIYHRLDLVLRLVDTTTGMAVEERNVRFASDRQSLKPISRGSGSYVFLNTGREDFSITVQVYGFDPCTVQIRYEELDSRLPMKEAFLIPSENAAWGEKVITFSGHLSGLEELEAVSFKTAHCCIHEFDERKRIMKVFQKGSRAAMEDVFYGLIHMDTKSYERFEVVREVSDGSFELKSPLQEPFSVNSPIARIVFGRVGQDGEYVLRVRDDSDKLPYLVRYVVNGEARFQVVDFHQLEEVVLQ